MQRVRDPLHNLIQFDTDEELESRLWKLIGTEPFQRLRRIKQLGFSDLVYPGASHSRFSHSLGVFHTARRLMEVVHRESRLKENRREQVALAAALVHDLGHGPFSHAFEAVGDRLSLPMADHEHVSDRLIRHGEVADILNELGRGTADDVADMITKEGTPSIHNAVVSSQFDADRLDYMRRDCLMTGSEHGAIDFDWLVSNLKVAEVSLGTDEASLGKRPTFVIGSKAIQAAEGYVLGLFHLYPTVYFHKATRGAEKIFSELLVRLISLARDGSASQTGLPGRHPLIRFARDPDDLDKLLELDDTVLMGSLSLLIDAEDLTISRFAKRIRDRKIFKCFDFRSVVTHEYNPHMETGQTVLERIDRCCASIFEKLIQLIGEDVSKPPRLLLDEATRSPYKTSPDSKGSANSINVMTDGGVLVDIKQRSNVIAALPTYKLSRAYYDRDQPDIFDTVKRVVMEEIRTCK